MGIVNGHLPYGGSLNPKTGRLGPKPLSGSTFKKLKRYETMIRMEAAGLSEATIAAMQCISVPRLRYIKKSTEYLTARIKLTHGIILDQEATLSQIKEQRKEMLTELLPPSLQAVADILLQKPVTLAEKKLQVAVAQDVMDREGTFAKVSRTEVKPVDFFDFEKHDANSMSVIAALRAATPRRELAEENEVAIGLNRAFAESHTLSAVDQQAALDELEASESTEKELLLEATPETDKIQ